MFLDFFGDKRTCITMPLTSFVERYEMFKILQMTDPAIEFTDCNLDILLLFGRGNSLYKTKL